MKIAKSEKLNLPFPFAYGIGMSSQCEGDSNLRKLDHDDDVCLFVSYLFVWVTTICINAPSTIVSDHQQLFYKYYPV